MDIRKATAYNVGILQGKAYRTLQNHLSETLSQYDLSIPEWKLLGKVCEAQETSSVELSKILDIDPPLVTVLVRDLEKKGFVKRTQNKVDKRASILSITTSGKRQISELEKIVRKELRLLLQGVSIREMLSYIKVLETIVKEGRAVMIKKSYLIE